MKTEEEVLVSKSSDLRHIKYFKPLGLEWLFLNFLWEGPSSDICTLDIGYNKELHFCESLLQLTEIYQLVFRSTLTVGHL